MNIRRTSARALLGAVALTLALGASLAATGSTEAAGLPGHKAGYASDSSSVVTARAKVVKAGVPHRTGRGLPG